MQAKTVIPLAFVTMLFLAGCVEEAVPETTPAPPTGPVDPVWVLPQVPVIDAASFLEHHAAFVSTYPYRAENAPGHHGARDFLAQQLADAGLVVWRQNFTSGIDQQNVCGAKLGLMEPEAWVVVGGHYDTTTWDAIALQENAPGRLASQGAYDDGSGTWITIELAKSFAQFDSYYSILFCAFDGEERGLLGSKAVYDGMLAKQSEDEEKPYVFDDFPFEIAYTRAMLDFDMFGICWPVRAPIYFDQNNATVNSVVQEIRNGIGIPDDMFKTSGLSLGQSDYANWYNAGIPTAFFISDFEELGIPTPVSNPVTPAVPGAYPFWHWVDTVETMMVMAGGPDMLEAGFQTALALGYATLSALAHQPEVALPPPAE